MFRLLLNINYLSKTRIYGCEPSVSNNFRKVILILFFAIVNFACANDGSTSIATKELIKAITKSDYNTVVEKIDAGADVNVQCQPGMRCSPLILAVVNGDIEIVKLLLEKGADPNIQNGPGDTPLIYALIGENIHKKYEEEDQVQVVELLLKAGADINKTNDFGISAYMGVCTKGHTELLKMFLDQGANPNELFSTRGVDKITPLMMVAKSGDLEAVQLLVKHGAKLEYRDSTNRSALDYAKSNKTHRREIATFLKEKFNS